LNVDIPYYLNQIQVVDKENGLLYLPVEKENTLLLGAFPLIFEGTNSTYMIRRITRLCVYQSKSDLDNH